jgi:tetratricopeptide (TPR) repeat protein
MGVSYEFNGDVNAAFSEYQKAVAQAPSSFPVQMRLGIVSSRLGYSPAAIKAFSAALEIAPDDMQVRYLLALVYSSIKDFDRAALQYEIILKNFTELEPGNIEFYAYLAELYYSQGKVDLGVAQFKKVIEIDPKNTGALLQVGAFYVDNGKRSDGVELLKRCIAVDPGQSDCLNALGYAYAEDNIHLDEAKEMLVKALGVEPDNAAYLDSLGWIYYKQGQFAQALDALQKAAAKEEDPAIYDHIGDVYEKLSQMDKALEMWQKAVLLDAGMSGVQAKISRAKSSLKKRLF